MEAAATENSTVVVTEARSERNDIDFMVIDGNGMDSIIEMKIGSM